ncbi:MAG: hypothetical protein ACRCRR_03210 [Rickettsia sp.]
MLDARLRGNDICTTANLDEILDDVRRQILLHHYASLDDQNLSVIHHVRLNVIYW